MAISCFSENGDIFLNRCLRGDPTSIPTIFADFLQAWINPRTLGVIGKFSIDFNFCF